MNFKLDIIRKGHFCDICQIPVDYIYVYEIKAVLKHYAAINSLYTLN